MLNNRYELGEQLGSGSYGVVHAGVDTQKNNDVAIKIARDWGRGWEMLEREWEILSGLNHENIVNGLDFGEDSVGNPFMVMELLDSTFELRNIRTFDYEQWLELGHQLSQGVVELWNQGWLHGDIYPRNIMLNHGVVKLLDFGMAVKLSNADEYDINWDIRKYTNMMIELYPQGHKPTDEYNYFCKKSWGAFSELVTYFNHRRNMIETDGNSLRRLSS